MAALFDEGAVKLIMKAESILKEVSAEAQRQTFTLVSFCVRMCACVCVCLCLYV